ncbi:STE3-domain-containing protein [Athelia psychrophila]|uniref:STE3-domain-containing protein n=1 Tax=Athelia psychrophila TaxID=1759441 RepID=A0A166R3B1_9AGAM|nr:STE3-domain-containing protein [Fibularhizoctonia sp. CBS 109695]
MESHLPAVSFICAASLFIALLSPRRPTSRGRANTSIASWLFGSNLIHGISSLIGGVEGWCDIVTNLLIAANVAILAACICTARNLEYASSVQNATLYNTAPAIKRRARYINGAIYIATLVIYMTLHVFVQEHRFDMLQAYGCQANFSASVLSIVLMWLPLPLMALVVFIYAGLALNNLRRLHHASWSTHLSAYNETMTSRSFFFQTLSSLLYTTLILPMPCYYFYKQTFEPLILSWSFKQVDFSAKPYIGFNSTVQADFSATPNVSIDSSTVTSQFWVWSSLTWWTVPALSFVYISLYSVELWMDSRPHTVKETPVSVLPVHLEPQPKRPMVITTRDIKPKGFVSKQRPRAIATRDVKTNELPSFWDDEAMKTPLTPDWREGFLSRSLTRLKSKASRRKSRPDAVVIPESKIAFGDLSPPNSPDTDAGDEEFKQTILGFYKAPTTPTPPSLRRSSTSATNTKSAASTAPSTASNIDEKWPTPPTSIPSNLKDRIYFTPKSQPTSISGSRGRSPACISFSDIPTIVHPAEPEPAFLGAEAPFQGSRVPSPTPPDLPPKSILKSARTRARRHGHGASEGNYGLRPEDVIYMTVVQEITT